MNEPHIAQKGPYVITEEKGGKIAWCQCGRSQNQPYCDGSHKGSGFLPIVADIQPGQRVAWCGCKHSGTKPFCDGTHAKL